MTEDFDLMLASLFEDGLVERRANGKIGLTVKGLAKAARVVEQMNASGIEAASAGETVKHGSTEGESPTRQGDAQTLGGES